jgi:ketosteroid isomerase-like protein
MHTQRMPTVRSNALTLLIAACLLAGCASSSKSRVVPAPPATPVTTATLLASPTAQVMAAERGFAKTMADRDFKAFTSYLSSEAIFFSGTSVQHGAAEVAAAWKPSFSAARAPFSWAPDVVEVLASGKLALSTGPVYIGGKVVSRYNAIWRLEAPNTWRVVFDKGEAVCGPEKP